MATEVIMPKAGMAMEKGTVIQWFKKPGDYVEAGEPLLEIETDKVAMEVEAEVSGYLLNILHGEGDEVEVIKTIGYIGDKDEMPPKDQPTTDSPAEPQPSPDASADVTAVADVAEPEDAGSRAVASADSLSQRDKDARGTRTLPATPAARRLATERGIPLEMITPSGRWGEVLRSDVENVPSGRQVSPLARKIAEENGVDLATVRGSGPGGRIMKRDVLADDGTSRHKPVESDETTTSGATERRPLRGMRKRIADRMSESHQVVPPVTLHRKVSVDELFSVRSKINESVSLRVSVTDMIVKAAGVALREAPYMRTAIEGDELVTYDAVDIGIAVALESGLVVPVIRQVDGTPLSLVAAQRDDLARRAREGALQPDELHGATFTVTNLGMYGITAFTPIVTPPQSGILGVNATEDVVVLTDGVVSSRKVMTLSLTVDHRIVDGAQGAIFLDAVAQLLENPLRMLV